jgi:tetratricopeptide (TPR) repeat protein
LHKENELIGRLEALRAADPGNPLLGHFLAAQYVEAKQADKAEAIYRQLAGTSPSIAGYRNLVRIYRQSKRYDDLLWVLGEAIVRVGALEPLADNGHPLAEDKDLVQGALAAARTQLNKHPKGFAYQSRLAAAVLALDAKQYDAAAEFYNAAIQSRPRQADRLYKSWGLGLALKAEHARAIEVFRRAMDQKALPADDPTFPYYLAGALELAGRTDQALAEARKAVKLASARKPAQRAAAVQQAEPDLADCLSRVAWILYHAKRYAEAAAVYGDLLGKYGSDYSSAAVRELLREARLGLSNIAVIQKDHARATEWLQQVLDEFPDDPGALNDLGYLWAEQGEHLERAHRMIRIAVEKEPDNAAYRDSLGWVLFQKGRVQEALPELEKAAAQEPDPTVLDHLGDAYRAVGRPQEAKQAWRRAVQAFQKDPDPEKMKRIEDKIKAVR